MRFVCSSAFQNGTCGASSERCLRHSPRQRAAASQQQQPPQQQSDATFTSAVATAPPPHHHTHLSEFPTAIFTDTMRCVVLSVSVSVSVLVCLPVLPSVCCLTVCRSVCLSVSAPRLRFTFQASNSIAPLMLVSMLLSILPACLSVWVLSVRLSVCVWSSIIGSTCRREQKPRTNTCLWTEGFGESYGGGGTKRVQERRQSARPG